MSLFSFNRYYLLTLLTFLIMNSGQESKNSMYLACKDYLAANATILTPLPNYSAFSTAFLGYITQIQTYGEQQLFDKSGIAESKSQLRNTLVLLAADTSRKVTAYAKFTNNQLLMNEIKYTESELRKIADTSLRDAAQGIYDRAQANLTALVPYGVTAATQTALQSAITAFLTSIPKPRLGIADKKETTAQLANLFKQADAALENIDTLVEIVRLSQPAFYKGYKGVRKIIDTGSGSLAIKIQVVDSDTGEPIKGVNVCLALNNSMLRANGNGAPVVINKKTAEKGGCNIKSAVNGMYSAKAVKQGFHDSDTEIAVNDGETTELIIKLKRK